jgi:hypothetical protein
MPDGSLRRWAGSAAATLQSANLLATFDPSYYADPSKLSNAPYAGNPPVVFTLNGNQLSIRSSAPWLGNYAVVVSATDGTRTVKQTFRVTVTPANTAPVLSAIANQTQSHGKNVIVTLNGSDADGDVLSYSALVMPANGQTPALSVTVQGNQLTVRSQQPIAGTYTIQVSASDGKLTSTRTFDVTLTNTVPTLEAIPAQTLAKGQTSLAISLVTNDADNDKLAFQAIVQTPNATAYQLNQQYRFQQYNGTYYTNLWGYNEKWLVGADNQWYALMPNGEIYRWSLSMTQTLKPTNRVATLDASFYHDPRLLWDAKPAVAPALTVSFQGNQLILQRPANLTGIFFIDVIVSDGLTTFKRTVQVILN